MTVALRLQRSPFSENMDAPDIDTGVANLVAGLEAQLPEQGYVIDWVDSAMEAHLGIYILRYDGRPWVNYFVHNGPRVTDLSPLPLEPIVVPAALDIEGVVELGAGMALYAADRCDLAVPRLTAHRDAVGIDEPVAAYYLANCALLQGDHDKAIRLYRTILRDDADRTLVAYNAAMNLAYALLDSGQPDAGIDVISNLLDAEDEPSFLTPFFYRNRAQLQALVGSYDAALADMEAALNAVEAVNAASEGGFVFTSTQLADLHTEHGIRLLDTGESEQALAAFNEALDRETSFVAARFYRGLIFANLGRPDDALAEFREVVNVEPQGELAELARTHVEALSAALQSIETD